MGDKTAFREAFIRRFNADDTKVSELCRATGVGRSKINKLLSRLNDRVEVEDAIAIARFYGVTVEEFIGKGGHALTLAPTYISSLINLLSNEEADLLPTADGRNNCFSQENFSSNDRFAFG